MSSDETEDTVSPHSNTTSPQDPAEGLSATRLGFFGILGEAVLLLIAVFVGIRFMIATAQPEFVAWISFGIAALLAIDLVRRIIRAVRRDRRARA